jgi:hypothetical protein
MGNKQKMWKVSKLKIETGRPKRDGICNQRERKTIRDLLKYCTVKSKDCNQLHH